MRAPLRARVTTLRCTVAGALALTLTGCATLRATVGGYTTEPGGIARPQQRLRDAVEYGDFAAALAWREDDALLRALNTGITAYYASQFARSAAMLDTAALLADDRITASLSKDALALVTNDLARPYQPRRTERLLIPYYGLLSYARLGKWEDAAVEARRLVLLLAQYADDCDDAERALHATLGYLAGAAFERAGSRGEAEVAYRAARALASSLPESAVVARAGEGELLVVVERGFVAHRTTETMALPIGDDERDSLELDEARRRTSARIAARAAARQAQADGGGRTATAVTHAERPRSSSAMELLGELAGRDAPTSEDDRDEGPHYLTIAFPALRRSESAFPGRLHLLDGDLPAIGLELRGGVDEASAVDERRERVAVATRALARAAAKYALTKAVKDKKGDAAGRLANFGSRLLERADVRAWHLLPQEITLLRVAVPEGTHLVRLQVGEGAGARVVSLGAHTVRAGEVVIAPVRLWRGGALASDVMPVTSRDSGCVALICR